MYLSEIKCNISRSYFMFNVLFTYLAFKPISHKYLYYGLL